MREVEGEPKAQLRLQTEQSPEDPCASPWRLLQSSLASRRVTSEPVPLFRVRAGQCGGERKAEIANWPSQHSSNFGLKCF